MSVQGERLGTAVLVLTTDAEGLDKGLAAAKTKTKTAVQQLQAIGNRMQGVGKKLSAAVTAPLIAMGVLSIKAAADQAEAVAKLEQAVINAGNQGEIAVSNLEAHASAMQKVVRFGDDLQLNAMAVIEALSGVGEQALMDLTDLGMDMATALDLDLDTIATAIGKTASGASDALSRYGVSIDEKITDPTARAAAIADQLRQKFEGAAEAAGKVGLGPWELFQNRIGEIAETFGNLLLPRLNTILDKLDGVLTWVENLSPQAQNLLITFAGIAAVTGPGLVFIGGIAKAAPAISAAVGGLSTVFTGLGTAVGALAGGGGGVAMAGLIGGPFGLAIAGFAALSGKAADLAKNIAYWIMDDATPKIKAFCDNIIQWFKGAAEAIVGFISRIVTAIADWVGDKLSGFAEKVRGFAEKVSGFFKGLFDAVVGHSYIPDMVLAIEAWLVRLGESMRGQSKGMVDDALEEFRRLRDLGTALPTAAGSGSSSKPGRYTGAAGPGGAVVTGQGDASKFAAVLSGIGQAAAWVAKQLWSLISSSETFQGFLDSLSAAISPLIEQIAGGLVAALTPLIPIVMDLANVIAPILLGVSAQLAVLIQATLPFWEALGTLVTSIAFSLGTLLAPAFAVLESILVALAPALELVSDIVIFLQPVLQIVGTVLGVLGGVVSWVIKKVTAFGKTIFTIVDWIASGFSYKLGDALKAIDWGGSLQDTINAIFADIEDYAQEAAVAVLGEGLGGRSVPEKTPGTLRPLPSGTGSSSADYGATYEQARPIDITVNVDKPQVYGGSLREFAIIIRDELETLDTLGI